ncbi:unnamed protein product [Cylindrotheca closterium]|uniref:Leucine-rich repeat domain-containing protein n=1 Tax=Cylindrotheca closterium TaxID=2856 RepID=A0AAD2G1K0_9STRA|nr:unnamed protein product [Cylindrotheca closterium]
MPLLNSIARDELFSECFYNKNNNNGALEIPQDVTEVPWDGYWKNLNWKCVDMRRACQLKIIGEQAFDGCKSLFQVFFAPNVQVVQAQAFHNCLMLHSVVGFDKLVNLTEIGVEAFAGCGSLTNMLLPPTIITLGGGAFFRCVRLQKVRLPPNNLNTIPSHAFYGCSELQEINLESTMVCTIEEMAFTMCVRLIEVGVPPTLETIGPYSFSSCKSLQTIHGLNQACRLQTIGREAFRDCAALILLDLTHTIVQVIQEGTFDGCRRLQEIVLNAELMDIASNAFRGCSALQTVHFHPSSHLKTIGAGAFEDCKTLNHVTFPSSLESIECEAFRGCSNLDSVAFQDGLRCIAEYAFFGCESLIDVTIPSSVDYLMENSFDGDSLERIDTNGDRLELSIRLWSMYPDAFVGLSEEKWCYLYCHDDKNFCSIMTRKDNEKLDCVKQIFANNLHKLAHWSISVGSIGT